MQAGDLYDGFIEMAGADQERAAVLLRKCPELLEHPGYLEETPLHDAAVENMTDAVRFLLLHGASPNVTNRFANSPLQEVVSIHGQSQSYLKTIEQLLAAGPDPHHRSVTTESAWEQVRDLEDLTLVRLVRQYAVK